MLSHNLVSLPISSDMLNSYLSILHCSRSVCGIAVLSHQFSVGLVGVSFFNVSALLVSPLVSLVCNTNSALTLKKDIPEVHCMVKFTKLFPWNPLRTDGKHRRFAAMQK